jgi:hypothetical protein
MNNKITVELESSREDIAEIYNYLHELMDKLGVKAKVIDLPDSLIIINNKVMRDCAGLHHDD